LKKALSIGKPVGGIIEYVFSSTLVSVYVSEFNAVIRMQMIHLFVPKETQEYQEKGKKFI